MMPTNTSRKVLIVTALPVECEAVLRQVANAQEKRHQAGSIYQVATFEGYRVTVAQVGAGNSSAAAETERAISFFTPDLALFVGIAGGIKDVAIGDVVAATKVYGYEGGADREHFQPRPEIGLPSYPLVQEARAIEREKKWLKRARTSGTALPRGFVGPLAAGAKVIKSSRGAVAALIRENYGDALAVEMEGEGFMRAAYANSVDAMVIRGISDLLDGKATADGSGSQELASDHAAAFAFELLAKLAVQEVRAVAQEALKNSGDRGQSETTKDLWTRLREISPRLYPKGPDENNVWENAGGDLSTLELSENARTQWSRAIRLIEKGGGGDISLTKLLDQMLQDFRNNYDLQYLKEAFRNIEQR